MGVAFSSSCRICSGSKQAASWAIISGMKTVSFLAYLAVPIFACAQSVSDSRSAVLASTHGRVHDLIADMFSRDSDTLEQWKSYPNRIPHTDEMCTAGEQAGLKMLVANVRALNSSPSDPSA